MPPPLYQMKPRADALWYEEPPKDTKNRLVNWEGPGWYALTKRGVETVFHRVG